jgi:hypothetical protein
MRASVPLVTLLVLLVSAGCGPTVDLTKGLQTLDVSSGWYDAGIVNGQNKLVPVVSFKLKNISSRNLVSLQVNGLFRRVAEKDEWGSGFITAAGSEGLAPGATTPTLTIRSQLGYTGTEPRQEMLHNSHFVDARVELAAKYGSTQWTRIGDFPVARLLITQ